jgi:hypothetical protein
MLTVLGESTFRTHTVPPDSHYVDTNSIRGQDGNRVAQNRQRNAFSIVVCTFH